MRRNVFQGTNLSVARANPKRKKDNKRGLLLIYSFHVGDYVIKLRPTKATGWCDRECGSQWSVNSGLPTQADKPVISEPHTVLFVVWGTAMLCPESLWIRRLDDFHFPARAVLIPTPRSLCFVSPGHSWSWLTWLLRERFSFPAWVFLLAHVRFKN